MDKIVLMIIKPKQHLPHLTFGSKIFKLLVQPEHREITQYLSFFPVKTRTRRDEIHIGLLAFVILFVRLVLKFACPCTKHPHLGAGCGCSTARHWWRRYWVSKLVVFGAIRWSILCLCLRFLKDWASQTCRLRFTPSPCTAYISFLEVRNFLILVLEQVSVLHGVRCVGHFLEFLISYLLPVVLGLILHKESMLLDSIPTYPEVWFLYQNLADQLSRDVINTFLVQLQLTCYNLLLNPHWIACICKWKCPCQELCQHDSKSPDVYRKRVACWDACQNFWCCISYRATVGESPLIFILWGQFFGKAEVYYFDVACLVYHNIVWL